MMEGITGSQLVQPPHSNRVPWMTLLRTVFRQLLNISRVIKCKKTCQIDWVLLLVLFGDWGDICFLPALMHFSWSPWPFKDEWRDLAKMSTSSFSTLCIQLGPIDLWMSSLTKWFLPQSSWTKRKSNFFQVFSMVSWVRYLWGLALAANTKKVFSISALSAASVEKVPLLFSGRPSISPVFLLLFVYLKKPCYPWHA